MTNVWSSLIKQNKRKDYSDCYKMSAMVTAEWFSLGTNVYYRKLDLEYNMNWSVGDELDSMVMAGAPYGGPIALFRNKSLSIRPAGQAKPIIQIYNCAGTLLSGVVWTSGLLVHYGWSDSERLLCITESGDVLVYDMFGVYQHTFRMGQEARDTKVSSAQLYPSPHGTGLAIMTASNRMFLVNNVAEPKIRPLPDFPRPSDKPTCWCVWSTTKSVIGLLVCRDTDIYKCPLEGPRSVVMRTPMMKNPYTQFLNILTSENGKNLALFTDSGILWIGSSDLSQTYCEIDTGYDKSPRELMWCGTEAVVGRWDNVLVIFGKSGITVDFPYDQPVRLISEMDCVRIVSPQSHELLQLVPQHVQKIFRINSMEPGACLFEASKQFQKRSHKADEYICHIKNELPSSVRQCTEAAAFEFQHERQKMLIRAAQFGKGFIPEHNPDEYVNVCRWLRVLNAVRHHKVAIPLTYEQVKHLGVHVLLDRLISRRLHCLARHIAAFLKLQDGQAKVLSHWACYKVSQPHLDNESVARVIAEKLRDVSGISYTDIALKAADKGRQALAIKILEYEPKSRLQVPLLLKLGESRAALSRAVASGDTDLLRVILLRLKEKMGDADFLLAIRAFPLAQALYLKYCASTNRDTLRSFYVQEDDHHGQAATHIRDALESDNNGSIEASMLGAREAYKKGKNDFGVSICEDARKLCKQQAGLRERFGAEFTNLSLHDTLYKLLLAGDVKLADKMRTEFKVPDRRYWWIRIQCLAEKGEWTELDKFSRSRRPPGGFEAFVDACLAKQEREQALKYLPRCRDDIKVKYYVKAGFYEEAARVAFEQKDESALAFVKNKCPTQDSSTQAKIVNYMSQMSVKK